MKFKKLTEEDINFIKEIKVNNVYSWDERVDLIKSKYEITERTVRKWFEKLGLNTKAKPVSSPQYEKARTKTLEDKKYHIITSCQSNTPIFDKFFDNIEQYAKFLDAEISVIPFKYSHNILEIASTGHTWAKRVVKYLNANRISLNKNLQLMGDIKILPTAKYPLSSLNQLSGTDSAIFGSPKLHLESQPTLNGDDCKLMLTTGAISKPNYSDSKAGKHGEGYHQYGFVIVEIQDKNIFHIRQVEANKDGSFEDLFFKVNETGVNRINEIEGVVLGDLHYSQRDNTYLNTTLDMLKELTPTNVILHDVFDGTSINPHTLDNPFEEYYKEVNNLNSLKNEIDELINGLRQFEQYENVVVVKSNHDLFLDRFLLKDWRKLPTLKNSLEYMEYSAMLMREMKGGNKPKGALPMIINKHLPKVKTLGYEDIYYVKHFCVSYHGEKGSNGSRSGGAKAWSRYVSGSNNYKRRGVITAHTHTISRYGDSLTVGHLLKKQDYTLGSPSSWIPSNVIIHKSGRAQHINIVNRNQYTTLLNKI